MLCVAVIDSRSVLARLILTLVPVEILGLTTATWLRRRYERGDWLPQDDVALTELARIGGLQVQLEQADDEFAS